MSRPSTSCLLIVPRGTPLRFDPALGFHLYGADICLQAAERGLAVVAIEALCYHNSKSIGLPQAFFRSAEVFARKWTHRLPVATPCVIVDRAGEVHVLGNAVDRVSSMAYALPGGANCRGHCGPIIRRSERFTAKRHRIPGTREEFHRKEREEREENALTISKLIDHALDHGHSSVHEQAQSASWRKGE